ncbi:dUTP diphosphatase [Sporosarcina sp. Sa2YVA2]|uniref:dUTP diphosphatase n=1 Tax=Sporosarcina quadrami TaxID=2762234 RepID=A0ABR8U8S1_9BACL|nr:dUTP diphosphatase [Sporosarcina quadrami]MBD7984426.1 dUTP diphosphatase [Sporosarcina quadrami]
MNLNKLFETQRKLDEKIVKEKGLEGQDLLSMKILALQVELGELANEWRGFKFWSENREPRTNIPVTAWGEPYKNPLLEEYVDCLHFILSIGMEVGVYRFDYDSINPIYKESDVTTQFLRAIDYTIGLRDDDYCLELLQTFIYLGEMLGFTWDEIETAYYAKNAINHERQESGY